MSETDPTNPPSFADLFQALMFGKRMSILQLRARTGIPLQSIQYYWNGHATPKQFTDVEAIANTLELNEKARALLYASARFSYGPNKNGIVGWHKRLRKKGKA